MEIKIRKFLDGRTDLLNGDTTDVSPAQQVFRTASAILALIRVSAFFLLSSGDSYWLFD